MVVKLNLSLQIKNMKNIYESSENEGQVVYSAGHYFEINDVLSNAKT